MELSRRRDRIVAISTRLPPAIRAMPVAITGPLFDPVTGIGFVAGDFDAGDDEDGRAGAGVLDLVREGVGRGFGVAVGFDVGAGEAVADGVGVTTVAGASPSTSVSPVVVPALILASSVCRPAAISAAVRWYGRDAQTTDSPGASVVFGQVTAAGNPSTSSPVRVTFPVLVTVTVEMIGSPALSTPSPSSSTPVSYTPEERGTVVPLSTAFAVARFRIGRPESMSVWVTW